MLYYIGVTLIHFPILHKIRHRFPISVQSPRQCGCSAIRLRESEEYLPLKGRQSSEVAGCEQIFPCCNSIGYDGQEDGAIIQNDEGELESPDRVCGPGYCSQGHGGFLLKFMKVGGGAMVSWLLKITLRYLKVFTRWH